jgi:branched-chain amino acid transport system ATP-binding protein
MDEPILRFDNVSSGYLESVVLDDFSFSLYENHRLAVLGRNGVGKTTLILTAMGFLKCVKGRIAYQGKNISDLPPHRRARLGLGWVPQEREIFPSLTVEENLNVARRLGPWNVKEIYSFFPRLLERKGNMGSQLSGGEQQMLAIARTLMTNPDLLFLDEPFEGLAPVIIEELIAGINRMASHGRMTFILIEQHAEVALAMTDEAIIIERGRLAYKGKSADLIKDSITLDRYLGLSL